jgi:DNA polymerase-1
VAAPIHDALLIEAPLDQLEDEVEAMRSIMERASACVTGGLTVRVDADLVRHPARYRAEDAPAMWTTAMLLLQDSMSAPDSSTDRSPELLQS